MNEGEYLQTIYTQVQSCVPPGFYGEITLHVQNGRCQFVSTRQTWMPSEGKWKPKP